MTLPATDADFLLRLDDIIAAHKGREGPLLPILHDIQEEWGHIPEAAQPVLAEALGMTRAEVYGVVSFYHDFRDHPHGRHVLRLCRAEACQSMGGDALHEKLQRLLGIGFGETAKDGSVTLEAVYCLGLCACSPSAMLDGEVIGRLDETRIAELAAEVRA